MGDESEEIVAVVTADKEKVMSGGAPIFLVSGAEEREKVSSYLSHILNAQIHDLENGVYILVRH